MYSTKLVPERTILLLYKMKVLFMIRYTVVEPLYSYITKLYTTKYVL